MRYSGILIVSFFMVLTATSAAAGWEEVSIDSDTIQGFNNVDKFLNSAIESESEYTIAEFNFIDTLINCQSEGYETVKECQKEKNLPLKPSKVASLEVFGVENDENRNEDPDEGSSSEDVQRFELTRNSDGLYSISGKNGYVVQSPSAAFGFGGDGSKEIIVVNEESSNPQEETIVLEKPDFNLKVGRNPPIAKTGEEVKVKITEFSGGSSSDPYSGIRAGGKEFSTSGDMETSSTDSSPGPEKAMVTSTEAGTLQVSATLTDNTPGDGIQNSKESKILFADGFWKDYKDETSSGRAISFTEKQNEITDDWSILHQEKGSDGYERQDWDSDVYDGSDRTPWIGRRLLGGKHRGVLSIKANHEDRDTVVNDIRVERRKDVDIIGEIMFRVFTDTRDSDAKFYLKDEANMKSTQLEDGTYRLTFNPTITGYTLYHSNSPDSKGDKVKTFRNFHPDIYGFEVDTSIEGVERGKNELHLDWIMTQSFCNNRDYSSLIRGQVCN